MVSPSLNVAHCKWKTESLNGAAALVPSAAERGVGSGCPCRDEQLPMYINIQSFSVDSITFLINRHAVIFQVSHLGLTDVSGFFWAHC